MRNRLPGGWGGGGQESRARPSLPISIRYKLDGVRIRVKFCDVYILELLRYVTLTFRNYYVL